MFLTAIAIAAALIVIAVLMRSCARLGLAIKERDSQLATQGQILQATEHQRELLFSAHPYPMWIFDRKTMRFLAVNGAAVEHYGYSREEFLTLNPADIRPPEDVPIFLDAINQEHLGLQRPGLWRHIRKDGSVILVEIASYRYEQHGDIKELVVAVDVTERRRMEEAVRESEITLKNLVDNAPFGIAQSSLDKSRLTRMNSAMLEILGGYSAGEAMELT